MNVRDEDGQALVLALAFLIFFGLVIGAMLAFAGRERTFDRTAPRAAMDGLRGGRGHGRGDPARAEEHDRRWVRGSPLPGGRPDGGDGPDPADDDSHHDRCHRRECHLHMVAGSVPTRTHGDVHNVRRGWFLAGGAGDRADPRHPEPGHGQRALLDVLRAQHVVLTPRDLRS